MRLNLEKSSSFSTHLKTVDKDLEKEIREQVRLVVHVLTDHVSNFEDKTLISEINQFINAYSRSSIFKDSETLVSIFKSENEIYDQINDYMNQLKNEIDNLSTIIGNYKPILVSLGANLQKVHETRLFNDTSPVLSLHRMHLQNLENKLLSNKNVHESLLKFKTITFPQLILNISVEIQRGNITLNKVYKKPRFEFKILSSSGLFLIFFINAICIALFTTGGLFVALTVLSIPMMIYGMILFLYGVGVLANTNKRSEIHLNQLWEKVIAFCVGSIVIKFIQKVLYGDKILSEEIAKLEFSFDFPIFDNFTLMSGTIAFLTFGILVCAISTILVIKKTKRIEAHRKQLDKFLK